MSSWMPLGAGPTADDEPSVEIARLNRIIREQNVIQDTSRAEKDKLVNDLHQCKLQLQELQGKCSSEVDLRSKAEAELDKSLQAARNFNALKVNYENTIQAQEDKMRALDKQVKQAEKELHGFSDSRASEEDRTRAERDGLLKKISLLMSNLSQAHHELDLYKDVQAKTIKAVPAASSRRRSSSFSAISNQPAVSDAEAQLEKLRSRLASTDQELILAQNTLAVAQKKSEREQEECQKKVDAMEEVVEEVQWQSQQDEQELKQLREVQINAERAVEAVKSIEVEKNALVDQVKEKEEAIETLTDKIAGLEATIEDLTASLAEVEVQLCDSAASASRLVEAEDRCLDLQTANNALQASVQELQLSLAESERANEASTSALRLQVTDLQSTLAASETRAEELQLELQKTNLDLKDATAEHQCFLSSLQTKIDAAEQEHEQLEMMFKISQEAADSFRGERDALLGALAALEKDKNAVEGMETMLAESKQDVENAEQRCRIVEDEFSMVAAERDELQTQIEDLKAEIQGMQATSDAPPAQVEHFNNKAAALLVARLRSERNNLNSRLHYVQAEYSVASNAQEEELIQLRTAHKQEKTHLEITIESSRKDLAEAMEKIIMLQQTAANDSQAQDSTTPESEEAPQTPATSTAPLPGPSVSPRRSFIGAKPCLTSSFSADSIPAPSPGINNMLLSDDLFLEGESTRIDIDDSVFFGAVQTPEKRRVEHKNLLQRKQDEMNGSNARAMALLEDQRAEQLAASLHLQARVLELQEQLAQEQAAQEGLSAATLRLETILMDVRNKLSEAEEEISRRTDEHHQALAAQQESSQSQIQAQRQEVASKDERISQLQAAADHQEEELIDLRQIVDDLRIEVADKESHLQQSVEHADELQALLEERQGRIESLCSNLDEQQRTAEDLETRLHQGERELERQTELLHHARLDSGQEVERLKHELQRIQLQHQTATEDLASAHQQTVASLVSRSDADEKIKAAQLDDLRKDNARLGKEISTLRGLISQKEETAARLESTLDLTRTEAENLIEDFNACSAQLEKREREDERREEQLIEQESAIDKLKQQSDALAAQHRLATEELVKLRQQSTNSTDLQASLAELEERMQSKEEEIEETEDRYLSSLKDIKKLQSANERLQVRCESLQSTVATLEELRSKQLQHTLAMQDAATSPPPAAARSIGRKPLGERSPVAARQQENQLPGPPSITKGKRSRPADLTPADANQPPRAIAILTSPQTAQIAGATPRTHQPSSLRSLGQKRRPIRSPMTSADRALGSAKKGDANQPRSAQLMASLAALRGT